MFLARWARRVGYLIYDVLATRKPYFEKRQPVLNSRQKERINPPSHPAFGKVRSDRIWSLAGSAPFAQGGRTHAAIVTVDVGENAETVGKYVRHEQYTFPVRLDEEHEVEWQYRLNVFPS